MTRGDIAIRGLKSSLSRELKPFYVLEDGTANTHHLFRDLYFGATISYPLSKRDVGSHAKNFKHIVGLKLMSLPPTPSSKWMRLRVVDELG